MTRLPSLGIAAIVIPIAAVGLFAASLITGRIEKIRPQLPAGYADSDLTFRGSSLKGYALGTEGLIADWYWMRSLQYIGDKVDKADLANINIENLTDLNPRLLYPLLENATDLDPHFLAAYSYGAIVLPAIDPEKAIAFTNKGIANNPDQWRLYQYLGYIYWRLNRFNEAADAYGRGAKIDGAPPFMRFMAASMQNEGGSRETARRIYTEMLDQAPADDEQTRIVAERALSRLVALDQMDAVNDILAKTRDASACPQTLSAIFAQLKTVKLPLDEDFQIDRGGSLVDPSAAPYIFDREKCEIHLDYLKTKVPTK